MEHSCFHAHVGVIMGATLVVVVVTVTVVMIMGVAFAVVMVVIVAVLAVGRVHVVILFLQCHLAVKRGGVMDRRTSMIMIVAVFVAMTVPMVIIVLVPMAVLMLMVTAGGVLVSSFGLSRNEDLLAGFCVFMLNLAGLTEICLYLVAN